jgi:hypothetical protein
MEGSEIMSAKDNPSRRGTIATMVATAAVTLAIGVTVAALGGYLEPRPGATVEQVTAPESMDPASNMDNMESPAVVLVPVTQQPPALEPRSLAPAPAEPEPLLAALDPAGPDDESDEDDDEEHEHRARGRDGHEGDDHDD